MLVLDESPLARRTRIDQAYLSALAAHHASRSRVRPNDTLVRAADGLHYVELRRTGETVRAVQVSAEETEYLVETLARAANGAEREALAAALVTEDIALDEEEALDEEPAVLASQVTVTPNQSLGTLTITYVPDRLCFELKSLKLYLQQFRNHGAFYERVTNHILDDLVASLHPRWMTIVAEFTPRGGIHTTVTARACAFPARRSRVMRSWPAALTPMPRGAAFASTTRWPRASKWCGPVSFRC